MTSAIATSPAIFTIETSVPASLTAPHHTLPTSTQTQNPILVTATHTPWYLKPDGQPAAVDYVIGAFALVLVIVLAILCAFCCCCRKQQREMRRQRLAQMENLNVGVRVEHPEERVVAEGYGPADQKHHNEIQNLAIDDPELPPRYTALFKA